MRYGVKTLLLAWLLFAGSALGHQIPSIQLEIEMASNGPHTLRLNVDPRLIISTSPASMPPVGVEWYRDQTPDEQAETTSKAISYISRTIRFAYGSGVPGLTWEITPMDGVSNQPLSDTTTEVHLLAVASHAPSAQESSLTVSLASHAAAALTIITLLDGEASQRAQVLFPGEASKPLTWAPATASTPPPPPATAFAWHVEPLKLVMHHVFKADVVGHVVFILVLGLRTKRPLLALAVFHLVHLASTFACSLRHTVVPQPPWLWPALCVALALPLPRARHALSSALIVSVLALPHVLNEWPTATEPRITCLMEAALAVSHLALLLPVLLIRGLWTAKKAAAGPPLPS